MKKIHIYFFSTILILIFTSSIARAEVDAEIAYIFNTFSFLMVLMFFMLLASFWDHFGILDMAPELFMDGG